MLDQQHLIARHQSSQRLGRKRRSAAGCSGSLPGSVPLSVPASDAMGSLLIDVGSVGVLVTMSFGVSGRVLRRLGVRLIRLDFSGSFLDGRCGRRFVRLGGSLFGRSLVILGGRLRSGFGGLLFRGRTITCDFPRHRFPRVCLPYFPPVADSPTPARATPDRALQEPPARKTRTRSTRAPRKQTASTAAAAAASHLPLSRFAEILGHGWFRLGFSTCRHILFHPEIQRGRSRNDRLRPKSRSSVAEEVFAPPGGPSADIR